MRTISASAVSGRTFEAGAGMGRRRRIRRFLVRGIATLAIGGFIGFLVPTVISDLSPKPDQQFPAPESAVARQFINAFAHDDQAVLTDMGVTSDIKLRASRHRADFVEIDTPIHLGSYVAGGGQAVHAYAARAVMNDGTVTMLGWRVATQGGGVGYVLPPQTIESP